MPFLYNELLVKPLFCVAQKRRNEGCSQPNAWHKSLINNGNPLMAWTVLEKRWLVEMKAVYSSIHVQKELSQMKQNQQIRTKLLTVIMAGFTGVGFAAAATAAGVGIGADANVDAGAQVTAPVNAQAGGSADTHMSTSGSANSNAQWQSGATRGADRAAERMSNTDGLEQSTAAERGAAGKGTAKTKRSVTR